MYKHAAWPDVLNLGLSQNGRDKIPSKLTIGSQHHVSFFQDTATCQTRAVSTLHVLIWRLFYLLSVATTVVLSLLVAPTTFPQHIITNIGRPAIRHIHTRRDTRPPRHMPRWCSMQRNEEAWWREHLLSKKPPIGPCLILRICRLASLLPVA